MEVFDYAHIVRGVDPAWNGHFAQVYGEQMMKPVLLFLALPLALVSFGFPATTPFQTQPDHVWRQSLKTDAARGTAYDRYTLTGKFLKAPPKGDLANRPALVVDCNPPKGTRNGKGKFVSADLLVGPALKIHYVEPAEIHGTSYFPKIFIQYRINDGKDVKEQWAPGSDKASTAIPKSTMKKLLRAQTVDITTNDDAGTPVVMKFDMPDPGPLTQGCNVDD